MAVEFQNSAEVKVVSGEGITIAAPAGFSAGDLFIAFITKDDDDAITPPEEFTVIQNIDDGVSYRVWTGYRIAEAEDVEWEWTGDLEGYYGVILRYTGHDADNPIHASDGTPSSGVFPIAPSVGFTDLTEGSLVLNVFGADDDDVPYTVPSQLTSHFNDSVSTTGGAGGDVSRYVTWTLPTGFVDGDWADEANAYDENAGTWAGVEAPGDTWSSYIELTVDSMSCDRIRFDANYSATTANEIEIDVYYSDGWHTVKTGAFVDRKWEEVSFETNDVTAARIKIYNDGVGATTVNLFEFAFGKSSPLEGDGQTGEAIFIQNAADGWGAITIIIEATTAEEEANSIFFGCNF